MWAADQTLCNSDNCWNRLILIKKYITHCCFKYNFEVLVLYHFLLLYTSTPLQANITLHYKLQLDFHGIWVAC